MGNKNNQILLSEAYYNNGLLKAYFLIFGEIIYGREDHEIGYIRGRKIRN